MFSNPWNLIGNCVIWRWISSVMAGAYVVAWFGIGACLSGPAQTFWVWAGIGFPIAVLVLGVPGYLVWSIFQAISGARPNRESNLRRGTDPVLGYGPIRTPKGKRIAAAYLRSHPSFVIPHREY